MKQAAHLFALLLLAAGCRFAPDLSEYTPCVDANCPAGYRCLEAEGICVSECGAQPCAPLDAGTEDASTPDAGPADTGPLRFVTDALPAARVQEPYVQIVGVLGGAPPYRLTLVAGAGSLPEGLAMTPEGTIGGTPVVAGSYSFVLQATDSDLPPAVIARDFSIAVDPASGTALRIATGALPEGTAGTSYEATLVAEGGSPPYQWSRVAGALPSGLVLSAEGRIYGEPTQAGETTLQLQVRDASSPAQSAMKSFALQILPTQGEPLRIATLAIPEARVGEYYRAELAATGGAPPYTWSLASGGSLPAGLQLSEAGVVSGTPTTGGSSAFTVQVADSGAPGQLSSRLYALTVTQGSVAPLLIETASLPEGELGQPYSTTLKTSGGTAPVVFAVTPGSALPPGLSLGSGGVLSGTPSGAGTSNLSVTATDATTPTPYSARRDYVLTIRTGTTTSPLSIATTSLPDGAVDSPYSQTLQAVGGTAPFAWALQAGALPPGLQLATSGLLDGTPTGPGTFSFTLKVTDSGTPPQTPTATLTLSVRPSALRFVQAALPAGRTGVPYQAQLNAAGGIQPYAFSLVSGTLPQGLTLEPSGKISGTPKSKGRHQFEVQVADSASPPATAQASLSIDIAN